MRSNGWNPTFRIQGQTCHLIGPSEPTNENSETFLQVYFLDTLCFRTLSQNPRFISKSFLPFYFRTLFQNPNFFSKSFYHYIFPYIAGLLIPKLYLCKFFNIIFPYIVSNPEQSRASQVALNVLELQFRIKKMIIGGPRVETLPPSGGNFRPILDRSISYPNPKLTCYAKIQCRLQELWPLESHSVKKKLGGGGGRGRGDFFFLVIGITYYLQNNFQSFWAVKIFTFKFYEYSISFIYKTYIRKNKQKGINGWHNLQVFVSLLCI